MDIIHKILTFLTRPLTLGLVVLVVCQLKDRKRTRLMTILALAWLWAWSTPLMTRWIGMPLETPYPPIAATDYPEADAICLLGGGMGVWSGGAEMWLSADRVWKAAQLWKAGKAKVITVTGEDASDSTVPLLKEFGVPTNAVLCLDRAKNTEDEASIIAGAVSQIEGRGSETEPKRVLLVTSANHMRRAEWLFKMAGLKVVPAACDYEVCARHADKPISARDFLPDAEVLFRNTYLWKEWFAYWCYRLRGR